MYHSDTINEPNQPLDVPCGMVLSDQKKIQVSLMTARSARLDYIISNRPFYIVQSEVAQELG